MMHDDKLDLIVQHLSKRQNAVSDVIVKIMTGLCTIGIVSLFGFCISMLSSLGELQSDYRHMAIDVRESKRKLEAPRHTKDETLEIVEPIKRDVAQLRGIQSGRLDRFSDLEKETSTLRNSISNLAIGLSDLKTIVDNNRGEINALKYRELQE